MQMATTTIPLSVVMPTFNRRKVLPRALESISAQDVPPGEFELIIVVDGSNDGTTEFLRSFHPPFAFRIIEQENRGLAVALNRGIAAARGRVVLLTDDDLVLHPSNFRAHLEAHESGNDLVVHGPVFIDETSPDTVTTDWIRQTVSEEISRWERGSVWPEDANLDPNYSVLREALVASGGYDETFRWRQNTEFGVRLVKQGLKLVYEPKAIAYHHYSKGSEEFLKTQVLSWGKEEVLLVRKHPELRRYSNLTKIATARGWKRITVCLAAQLPVSLDLFLWPVFKVLECFRYSRMGRELSLRLLSKRMAVYFLRGAINATSWRELQRDFGKRLPVLMYHHVGPPDPNFDRDLTVLTEQFEAQIRFLRRRGYVGIRPSDWLAWVRFGKPLPEKPVLLTFDDAFEDLKDSVFPFLSSCGFGGLVFVATNFIGKSNLWDESRGFNLRPCLNAEQIRFWSRQGIDFGAHSRRHPDLTKIAETDMTEELAGSQSDLSQIVGKPVINFAYPYGHYNACAADRAGKYFELSYTTDDGLNTLCTDLSLLHRNMVYAWDHPMDLEFLVRLGRNPIREFVLNLRKRLRFLKVIWRKLSPAKSEIVT